MNAADLYREAFARLPGGDLAHYRGYLGRDDGECEGLVGPGRDSIDLLHRAAGRAACDWGVGAALGVPDGDFAGARRLSVLALLDAEMAFRRGDFAGWIEDVVAVMAMGRHLGRGKYISGLAGFPVEDLAATRAMEALEGLDVATCRALAGRLDALPAFPRLSDAVAAEAVYFRKNYLEKFEAMTDEDLESRVRKGYGVVAITEENAGLAEWLYPDGDPAERMLLACGGGRDALVAMAEDVMAGFEELGEIAADASGEGAGRLLSLRVASGSNPLMADVLRSFGMMLPIWERFAGRFGLLKSKVNARVPRGLNPA